MEYKAEKILPYNSDEKKSLQVRQMFNAIAPSYDLLNRVMTFGIDRRWRKIAINMLGKYAPDSILDMATGTGDLVVLMQKMLAPASIIGADLSDGMLEVARKKIEKKALGGNITFENQDCLSLTYPDNRFDAVTVAFGVRNFEHLATGFAEMYRVLKPGGALMVIELSTPENPIMRWGYTLYSSHIIPFMGQLLSKDGRAYKYLPRSIAVVPQGEAMLDIFREVGFTKTKCRKLTFGTCSIYIGEK